MGIVNNNRTLNQIINESIYHIESIYSDDKITWEIIIREAKNLSETLHKYHYPKKIRNAAKNEFYKYFSMTNEK